jgi:ribosome biogenesis GTPase / thiamine phosphate phosphatase
MIDFDIAALRRIGLTNPIAARLALHDRGQPARVASVHRTTLILHDGLHEFPARPHPSLDASFAVGDWVLFDLNGQNEAWVHTLVDPLNELVRRDAHGTRQRLAANVDTALLVMGLDGDFNLRRLERYLMVAKSCDVAPVIVLTKGDLVPDADAKVEQVSARLPATVPVVRVHPLEHGAAEALAPWTGEGQTLVLLGTSGVGKSTLTNTLADAQQQTGGVRKGDDRGRHTTTSRSLHLCAGGACVIDTPGLRSWQPDADEDDVNAAFDDIETLAAHCRFHDCSHMEEPGCAVRGAVDADRLRNYHKLLREVRYAAATPLDRIAERSRWKVLNRMARARAQAKR